MPDGASAFRAAAAPDRIVFLGHSTVLIELDGVRLLTDPFLRSRVAHLRRLPAPPDPRHYAAPEAILISHLHQDHLDLPSLRLIGSQTPLVIPAGAGAWLRGSGFSDVRELGVGEQLGVGALTVMAVPAHHDGHRRPRGPHGRALGFIVSGPRGRPQGGAPGSSSSEPGLSIYFAGDTQLFAGMAELAPSPDVALLPVAGWGPTLGPGHMDPLHAARAARLIAPRLAIPIHWGTLQPVGPFWGMTPSRIAAPPRRFAEHVASLAPGVEVRVLAPGGETVL